jgi:hypothetical protein
VTIFTSNATRVASGNRGYIAALSSDPLETLRAGLAALARRYAGEPVHGDLLRMAAQVERIASRAGAL